MPGKKEIKGKKVPEKVVEEEKVEEEVEEEKTPAKKANAKNNKRKADKIEEEEKTPTKEEEKAPAKKKQKKFPAFPDSPHPDREFFLRTTLDTQKVKELLSASVSKSVSEITPFVENELVRLTFKTPQAAENAVKELNHDHILKHSSSFSSQLSVFKKETAKHPNQKKEFFDFIQKEFGTVLGIFPRRQHQYLLIQFFKPSDAKAALEKGSFQWKDKEVTFNPWKVEELKDGKKEKDGEDNEVAEKEKPVANKSKKSKDTKLVKN